MAKHSWVVYLGTFIIFGILLGGCITGALAHFFSSWGPHFPNPDPTTIGWYFWRALPIGMGAGFLVSLIFVSGLVINEELCSKY